MLTMGFCALLHISGTVLSLKKYLFMKTAKFNQYWHTNDFLGRFTKDKVVCTMYFIHIYIALQHIERSKTKYRESAYKELIGTMKMCFL